MDNNLPYPKAQDAWCAITNLVSVLSKSELDVLRFRAEWMLDHPDEAYAEAKDTAAKAVVASILFKEGLTFASA